MRMSRTVGVVVIVLSGAWLGAVATAAEGDAEHPGPADAAAVPAASESAPLSAPAEPAPAPAAESPPATGESAPAPSNHTPAPASGESVPAPTGEAPAPTAGAEAPAAEPAEKPGEQPAEKPGETSTEPSKPEPGEKPASPETQAEELFAKGRDALLTGRFDEAIALLGRAVELDQTKTGYRLHLARALRFADKTAEAAAQLEQILKTTPDHVEAGQDLAEIYTSEAKWAEVVRVLEPLLKYRHDYPTYHLLAEAQYNLGKHDDARKNYEEAIKLNPQSAADHYQLGNLYLAANLFARAAEMYQAALRLGIDTPVLRYKLGSAYFNLRNYFGTISVQTIRSGKVDTIHESWYLIEPAPGRKDAFRCASPDSAIYQIAKAMADGIEDRPDIRVLKASIYLNARRYAQAYDLFTEIQPIIKEDQALFHYYYAQAAFGSGKYDRYLELLEEAIRLDPDAYRSTRVDAYLAVADQYNQQGDLAKYIEYVVKAVAESPRTAALHLKLGNAYEESRQFDRALVEWQMVLDLEPEHPERLRLLNLIQKYRAATPSSAAR